MSKLSIVLPAYNEEGNIDAVVGSLLAVREQIRRDAKLSDVEVIVVNDGSTDSTGDKLKEHVKSAHGALRVVTHSVNSGYGAALKTGFRHASGDYVSFMDADGTIDPQSFVKMYQALQSANADMVVGHRFAENTSEMPLVREAGNRFFGWLLSFLSGEQVSDTASGMRLFKRSLVPLLQPLPDGLHFTPAMSSKVVHEKLKIIEVPIPYAERGGQSKLNVVSDGVRFFRIIVGTVLLYNPFKVFLMVGLLFELAAAALITPFAYAALTQEQILFSDYIYRSIGALYFFTAGIQIVLFGILARFMVSTFFKRHETGQFIHRVNDVLKVYDRMTFYGLGVLVAGGVINALYFWEYVFGGGLNLHWAWLLLGAGLIIVGLQMLITGVIMRILKDIKAATLVE